MSLFGSIQLAANTLRANDIALQVVGQNIANVQTPGYIREEVVFEPAPAQKIGDLNLGLGVRVEAIVQKIDHFLEERLRGSVSDRADAETQEKTYIQLEELIGELSDLDISTAMNDFFASIADVLNDPGSDSVRNLAVLEGGALADTINRLAQRIREVRTDINERIVDMSQEINRLIDEIRVLNVRIAETEGGSVSKSDAVGLRDQRLLALESLAELIDIRVKEQTSAGVAVYRGGDFLVYEGIARDVEVHLEPDRGLTAADIRFVDTDYPLNPDSGELHALLTSRDEILGGFLDRLDEFAATLVFEFNKIYSAGQGLRGFDELTAEFAVDAADVPLDEAGLKFTPVNGSFEVLVYNREGKLTETSDIRVDLNGLDDDTSMDDLLAQLNAVSGVSASMTSDGKLTVSSVSVDQEIAFANDTSGLLAVLGVNTFFTGYDALSLGVAGYLREDPGKFAASRGGVGVDTENAVGLADFLDRPLEAQDGASLGDLYHRLTADAIQSSAVSHAAAEGARVFEDTLRGEKLSISGVSLDEEAIRMISFQAAFQASAKYIGTLNELLDTLVNL